MGGGKAGTKGKTNNKSCNAKGGSKGKASPDEPQVKVEVKEEQNPKKTRRGQTSKKRESKRRAEEYYAKKGAQIKAEQIAAQEGWRPHQPGTPPPGQLIEQAIANEQATAAMLDADISAEPMFKIDFDDSTPEDTKKEAEDGLEIEAAQHDQEPITEPQPRAIFPPGRPKAMARKPINGFAKRTHRAYRARDKHQYAHSRADRPSRCRR